MSLIVGANNSGKTALLEAFEAVASSESPFVLYRASLEREPLPFLLQTRQAISEATMAKIPETEEAFVLTDAAPAVQPAATSG